MKGVFHITFYFNETRLVYLNNVIDNLLEIDCDIFIHTNKNNLDVNKKVNVITHEIEKNKPFLLTWKHRDLLKKQIGKYDFYSYLEDDILFTKKNLEYWEKYHYLSYKNNYYLGFIRLETDGQNWFCTDITKRFNKKIIIENYNFYKNKAPVVRYCGFWIINNQEMEKYSNQKFFDLEKSFFYRQSGYSMSRESSAYGAIEMYSDFIIANEEGAFVHHLPNNYINSGKFCTIRKEFLISNPS